MNLRSWLQIVWLAVPFIAFGIGLHVYRNAWVALGLYHVLILLVMLLHRREWRFRDVFAGFRWGWALALTLGVIPLILGLVHLGEARGFGGPKLENGLARFGLTEQTRLWFVFYFCAINPVMEEVFWRRILARKTRLLTLDDVVFGAFPWLIVASLVSTWFAMALCAGLATIGWFWRQLAVKTQGLSLPVLGHIAGDIAFCVILAALLTS